MAIKTSIFKIIENDSQEQLIAKLNSNFQSILAAVNGLGALQAASTINGVNAYRFEDDVFQLQIPGSSTAIHGDYNSLELCGRNVDFSAYNITGLEPGFDVIEKTIATGSVSANGYASKTLLFDDVTDNILAVAYIRSEDSDIVPYRWDFSGTKVNIGVRNVLGSTQSTTIHVGILAACSDGSVDEEQQ